jgi:glycosyltransferase involved in cell wall biosynthesis
MHILQLTDFYYPAIGGVESYVRTLSGELVRTGHTVVVVTMQPGDLPDEETVDGVRIVRIGSWSQHLTRFYADAARPFLPPAPDPGAVAALRRIIRQEQPDVVHSHSWLNNSYFPLHSRRRGPAHVVTLHDFGMACPRKTLMRAGQAEQCAGPRLGRCLSCAPAQYGLVKGSAITIAMRASRPLHQRADRYLAVSAAAANGSRPGLPAGAEVVVHPPMVPDGLRETARDTPRPQFLPADDGFVMFAGALGRHKGVDVLLAARGKMRHQARLVLLGTPQPDTPAVDDPGVTVVYNVPHPQVMASWARASVAVMPSVCHEALGFAAVEAMIAGRPVVASSVGGLREMVRDGATGLLVPPGDAGALAAALDTLLDDPGLRQRMGAAGQERTRDFGVRTAVPFIVAAYRDAVRRRPARAALPAYLPALAERLLGRQPGHQGGRAGADRPRQGHDG